jgi:nitrate reductase gamma subunit
VVARFVMFSRLPMALRWELYPVAHEPGKASYGGSYLEEFEWWNKPRETSTIGELKVMVPEILFLEALKEHNRKMWTRSFPFHFGLYLVIASTVCMLLAGVLTAIWPDLAQSTLDRVLQYAALIFGVAGMVLGIYGALGLLIKRLTSRDLKPFTTGADFFNLVFFIVAFGVSFVNFVTVDREFLQVSSFIDNLVSFNLASGPVGEAGTLLFSLSVVLLSILLAYIPMTHMSHFVGKYFAYHSVRWNDEPNLPGSKSEGKVGDLLNQNLTWAAPHIKGDQGGKTWGEAATENPARSEEK